MKLTPVISGPGFASAITVRPSRGMVVSAHGAASEAGAAVLRKGGNAFDAAVATSLMLGSVEPAFSGVGGGGFALAMLSNGETFALDYRETAPAKASPSMFDSTSDSNRAGPLAIATPGLVAGHAQMLEAHGTMKFAELVGPAIETAKTWTSMSLSREILRDKTSEPFTKLSRFEGSRKVFLGTGGNPRLAKTLLKLTDGPAEDEFYHGSIAKTVSKHVQSLGGILSEDDFAGYKPRLREPVKGEFRGNQVVSMPPPSAGGTLLTQGLAEVEKAGKEGRPEVENARVLEAVLKEKWMFGDPDVGPKTAKTWNRRAEKDVGSTSHFSVLDSKGNALAVTETVECYYGSGVTVPELGLVMNDEMHDFDVHPGGPNSVAPLKRPASSMTPTIVTREGAPFLILGGAGSERIITSVFQTIRNVMDLGMSLESAVGSPRIHPAKGVLEVEGGVDGRTVSDLERSGYKTHSWPGLDKYFGGVQAIMVDPRSGHVVGAADPRRAGAAAAE